MKSEFGKGQCYNLGLFIAHTERIKPGDAWFYGAGDHILELDCEIDNPNLKKQLSNFKEKVLTWRLAKHESDYATKNDYIWAINEAKTLLRLIDEHHGIETIKGEWE